ncbi:MAG TPA: hypothetical protein VF502_17415 [Stellaceae bacterium]
MESATPESPERPAPAAAPGLLAALARPVIEIGLMLVLLPIALLASVIAARQARPRGSGAGDPS